MIRIILISILMAFTPGNHYRLYNGLASGQSSQEPLLRFGAITDVQYCDCPADSTRYYANSLKKLEEAIVDLNRYNPAFIINLGDLIDRDFNSYDSVLSILAGSAIPVYNTMGNHDLSVENRYKSLVPGLLGNENGYYSFVIDKFRFIVLNSNDVSLYSPDRRSRTEAEKLLSELSLEQKENAWPWNGTTGDKQTQWFIDQLDAASEINQRVIVFSHHPVWPQSPYNMLDYDKILDIIKNYSNIGAWFSGHNHSGNYGNLNLVHFVTLRGMVETENLNSYAIIELYNNRIWIKGKGREKRQILAW